MRIDRLGDLGAAPRVLRAVGDATNRLGLPPPAALTGDWFGALAVIAPSVSAQPVDPGVVFAVRPGADTTAVGGGWVGYLSYPDPGSGRAPEHVPQAAGEVYQACVCTQFTGSLAGAPLDFFVDAVAATSPARAAYVAGPWGAVASLSPELFLRRCGEVVTSSPIKGTLPLQASPSALRSSVKDVAENIMIVDLVRNDLGRVALTGTVSVPELLAVRRAPGVWHLVSTVSARVPVELPTSALLDAAFPPASVTGTPKLRARQLISQWEQPNRGVYCGTIGFVSPMAGCELNVAIRTVEFDAEGNAVLGSGGGITADSNPDAEWDECLHKAAPILGLTSAVTAPARAG